MNEITTSNNSSAHTKSSLFKNYQSTKFFCSNSDQNNKRKKYLLCFKNWEASKLGNLQLGVFLCVSED